MDSPNPEAEAEAILADLTATTAQARRRQRQVIWMSAGLILGVGMVNLGSVALLGAHQISDTVAIGALMGMGIGACWMAWTLVQNEARNDARYIDVMRKRMAAEIAMVRVTPLLEAIKQAHSQGEALVVTAADQDDEPMLPMKLN